MSGSTEIVPRSKRNEVVFLPLPRSNNSDRITGQIRELIVSGELSPGDRLPAERILAQQFGVSRATIREAVSALVALNLLDSRIGDGTYVNEDLSAVLRPLALAVALSPDLEQDLHEARLQLEPAIASMAAKRATPEDLDRLLVRIRAMEAALGDPTRLAEADFEFHIELARSAHNHVFIAVIEGLQSMLRGLIAKRVSDSQGRQLVCFGEHLELYEAVVARQPEHARAIMARSVGDFGPDHS